MHSRVSASRTNVVACAESLACESGPFALLRPSLVELLSHRHDDEPCGQNADRLKFARTEKRTATSKIDRRSDTCAPVHRAGTLRRSHRASPAHAAISLLPSV